MSGLGGVSGSVLANPFDGLAGTVYYANTMIAGIGDVIAVLFSQAMEAKSNFETYLNDLSDIFDNNITEPTYTPSFLDVPMAFTAPTLPTALPARGLLISESQSNNLFTKATDQITKTCLANERQAMYQAAANGIGMMSASLAKRLEMAQQATLEATAKAALEQAAVQAEWTREDILAVINAEFKRYEDQLAAEGERRNWTQLMINAMIEEWKTKSANSIQWAQIMLDKLKEVKQITASLQIGVFQALMQAINVSASGQGGQNINTSESESTSTNTNYNYELTQA